jgi:hypothetical protein
VPIANIGISIYVMFFSGTDENNDYGAMPVENTLGVKILGLIVPVLFLIGIIAAMPEMQELLYQY